MQATINFRVTRPEKMNDEKYERFREIIAEHLEEHFPEAIIRVRPSTSISELSVFGLGKSGKQVVGECLERLFENAFAFDELNDEYY